MISLTVLVSLVLLAAAAIATADVPNLMQYQGFLTDESGEPLDDTLFMTFRIYDHHTLPGPVIWAETSSVIVTSGLFNVLLGSVNPISDIVFADTARWLGITVAPDPEIVPRTRLVTVPWAYRAATVDGASGGEIFGDLQLHSTLTVGEYEGDAGRIEVTNGVDPVIIADGANGKVGIGTSSPAEKLHVAGDIRLNGGRDIAFADDSTRIYESSDDLLLTADDDVTLRPDDDVFIRKDEGPLWVRFDNDNQRLGIGTTSPAHKLDVYGTIFAAHVANDAGIYMDAVGGSYGRIQATNAADNAAKDLVLQPYGGNVGIGTTDPTGKLGVASSGLYSGYFTSDYSSGATHVIHSEFTGSGNDDAVAVWGESRPADGWGYGGIFVGGARGVVAQVQSTGTGIYMGVDGAVYGGSGINCGVQGIADGGGTNYGVYGSASGAPGASFGVYGSAGPYPDAAGYFDGDVGITGTLYGGKGSSKIDHPLDPENKYLYHSFVESPDMMNVYNGNVVLDGRGEATVELPAYFEAANKDFRYQLTAIGVPGPKLHIAEKISGNRFKIAGGEPAMEVSWMVTGIRKDAFAEANRIQVEKDKPYQERGKYLHAEAHGLGKEYGIHYEQHQRMEERLQSKNLRKTESRQ